MLKFVISLIKLNNEQREMIDKNSNLHSETHTIDPLCLQVIDTVNAEVGVVDLEGNIIATNEQWSQLGEKLRELSWYRAEPNSNQLELLQKPLTDGNDFALQFLIGLKSVLSGEKQVFEQTYPLTINDENYWYKTIIKELYNKEGALIIHEDVSSHVKNKQYIKETQQRFDHHFENNFYGILVVNSNFQIIEANKTARSLIGLNQEEIIFSQLKEFIDLGIFSDISVIHDTIKKAGSYLGEFRLHSVSQKSCPIEVSATTFRNELGIPVISFAFKDVSSQKLIEERLYQEQEFTKSAIASLPTPFFVFDTSGKLVRWNNMLENELGYTKEELSQKNILDLVHQGERGNLTKFVENGCPDNSLKIEVRTLNKKGEIIHFFVSGKSFEENGKKYIVGGALNLNDIKSVEVEKIKNETLLKQLFHNSPIGIVQIDSSGIVKSTNRSFERIFGYSSKEIFNKNLDLLLAPNKESHRTQGLTLKSLLGSSFQEEAVRIKKDGTEIPVLIGGVPVKVDNEIISIFGMYVDISERKNLENKVLQLLESEKNARLRLEEMFDESPSAIALLHSKDHVYSFANDKYEELVGRNNLVGKSIHSAVPELYEQGFKEHLDLCFSDGKPHYFKETAVYFKPPNALKAKLHYLNFAFKPLFDEVKENEVYGIFLEAIDVTEQVEARITIQKSLEEKEALLHEVHHRVKNNLAIISGLIELELMTSEDKNVLDRLSTTHTRITTIAKVHELLYQNDSLSHIPFHTYIKNVIEPKGNDKESSIFGEFTLADVSLNVNQAIPVGMLLNEVISNFENKCKKNIESKCVDFLLNNTEELISITLIDRSKTMFKRLQDLITKKDGLSIELIDVLLKQVHGELRFENLKADTIIISFKKREAKGAYSAAHRF